MKRCILFLIVILSASSLCFSQQWMTSFDAAKRIALVQDKFLFVIWEDAALIPYPVIMNDAKGNEIVFDNMFDHQEINQIIWEYFVPVKLSEDLYGKLYDQIKDTRNRSYIAQFEDDNIKIMDVNGFILNRSVSPEAYFNLSEFISRYALNTSFLKAELGNYAEHKDFNSAFRLAFKYMDYAILVDEKLRKDVINMANMYLDNADKYVLQSDVNDKNNLTNKSNLLRLSQDLIRNRPGKVLRQLKKYDGSETDETNEGLLAFLYYTAYQLKNDKKDAEQWKSKVSLVNLRKAELITNLHL
ncbi:hypothetical protein LX77_00581 [Gelidibacter algens]|uniref:Uncharacterized protein n=1 Tax=Gelidibacter algens TaxID=49280 RepID=A0A327SG23_9FLAO|nr:hypothetical protein [Gelidibacter algens]RAJ28006.1 hypothetical protein LX77_00581 [Gelidibacter algens]